MDHYPPVYRVQEFCEFYKISRTSFYKEVSEGRLQIFKRGSRTFVTGQEARRWLATQQREKEAGAVLDLQPGQSG